MTSFIIIYSIILLVLIIAIAWSIITLINQQKTASNTTSGNLGFSAGWKVYTGLILTALAILAGFFAPILLTRKPINSDFDFSSTGQIGDTIGGLSSPFLGVAGVIMTGLAFYVQFKANQQQREQFLAEQAENKRLLQEQIDHQNRQAQLSQFESQFYEMLKLHRDNIQETEVTGYDFTEKETQLIKYEKITTGRKVFVVMKTELDCILGIYKHVYGTLNHEGFKKCYQIFFGGLDSFAVGHPHEKAFTDLLFEARNQHENPQSKDISSNRARKEFKYFARLYFNYKPFSGHASRLGHYFRHLYLSVKSVAKSSIITDYSDRMKYITLLRAQLSNHEQMLLFYNWLSDYGSAWENNENAYFTEYKMIHNLWYNTLFNDDLISTAVNNLRTKPVVLRKGKMFEIDE